MTILHAHLEIGDSLLFEITIWFPMPLPAAEVANWSPGLILRVIISRSVQGSKPWRIPVSLRVPAVPQGLGRTASAPSPLITALIASPPASDERRRATTVAGLDSIVITGGKLPCRFTGWPCWWHWEFRFGDRDERYGFSNLILLTLSSLVA